jgi:putative ABC transport system permease protein
MIFTMAWRNLWRNKRRTLITVSAVLFAVFLSTLMDSLQAGVYENNIRNLVSFYSGYVQVHQKGYWDDQIMDHTFESTPELEQTILANAQVEAAVARLESFALAAGREKTTLGQVVGTDPVAEDQLTKLSSKVIEGAYLQAEDQAVLVGKELAEKLELGVGDSIVLMGQGYHGVSANGLYPIKGIVSMGSPDLNRTLVYLPLAEAQYLYGAGNRLTSYALLLDGGRSVEQVVEELSTELDSATYEVMDWESMMPWLTQLQEVDSGGNRVMLGILYLIVAFVIFGTVLMMLQERSYEFGVIIAVGMKKIKVAIMVVAELFLMTLLGLGASLLFTIPTTIFLHYNPIHLGGDIEKIYAEYGFEAIMPASLDPEIFIYQGVVVFILTSFIFVYAIWKVLRINPMEAMRMKV